MGSNRGQNDISYAMYEELEGRLRVDPYAEPPYIYKRIDIPAKVVGYCFSNFAQFSNLV